jgi:hypothetical protein
MAIELWLCEACVKSKGGNNVFGKADSVSLGGTKIYKYDINSDPRTAPPDSLFMKAWNALPGTKSGNVYECEHSKRIKLTFNNKKK